MRSRLLASKKGVVLQRCVCGFDEELEAKTFPEGSLSVGLQGMIVKRNCKKINFHGFCAYILIFSFARNGMFCRSQSHMFIHDFPLLIPFFLSYLRFSHFHPTLRSRKDQIGAAIITMYTHLITPTHLYKWSVSTVITPNYSVQVIFTQYKTNDSYKQSIGSCQINNLLNYNYSYKASHTHKNLKLTKVCFIALFSSNIFKYVWLITKRADC